MIDFITGWPHTPRKHDSIWVIVERFTTSMQFWVVKTIDLVKDLANNYINKIVRFHGFPLSFFSD